MAENTLEILIPVRNPTEVLRQSVESLAAQTERNFSVLISDNFSTKGQEYIEQALALLAQAGVSARRIQPPFELGRVEHWNWLHYQSRATWLKPLFAGDWLEPHYVATVKSVAAADARCRYIFFNYSYHRGEEVLNGMTPWRADRYFTPREMQEVVLRYAMQFGPPSTAAYQRDVFLHAGGYDPAIPICADSLFFCKAAARHGAYGTKSIGAHFALHGARFSDTLPGKQRETLRESVRYLIELGLTAWHERWYFPKLRYVLLLSREISSRLRSK